VNIAQFNGFLAELGVDTIPTDMSFGVSACGGALEWGSCSIWSFIGSLKRLFSPWFWRLAFDILRFTVFAKDALYEDSHDGPFLVDTLLSYRTPKFGSKDEIREVESIGAWLKRKGYSPQFITYFLIPMVASPWCIDPIEFAHKFPARPLIQFM